MLCSEELNQAAISPCMIPSLKERPSMTRGIFSWQFRRLHFFDADWASLNIMAKLARLVPLQ